tara:strand:+ start:5694 stop:6944 length:1251 start_codon:yes stop_codon:yes gene_type:complete
MNSITLKEQRSEMVENMETLLDHAKSEDRDLTDDETKQWEGFDAEIKSIDKKISIAERQEELRKSVAVNMSVQTDQEAATKEMKSWSLFKAVKEVNSGGLTGIEKEMHQEAEKENRSSMMGIGLPSFMTNNAEKRAVIDQGTSAIQPVSVNAFADGLVEGALYNVVGINNLGTLAADTIVPITGANTPVWDAENDAATDVGNDFAKITLSPNRITGYADLSNQILIQNGTGAEAAIMRDMGRQIAKQIDANMFANTSAANGPASIVGGASVLTFTEAATYSSTSVAEDLLMAIQTLADDHGLDGNLGFVNSFAGYSEIKKSAMVGSVSPLYNDNRLAGYNGYFSSACGSTGSPATSFNGLFGDFSRVYFGTFGATNILVDPYSASGSGAVRLMVNQYYDWGVASDASFVKYTSLLS